MASKPRILFVVPLPPPVHGSSMMCDFIRKSEAINKQFDCDFVNLSTSASVDEIGKGGLKKYLRFAKSFFNTFWKLLTRKYDACYFALTCHGPGFLKDAPFVLLAKLFRRKIILHQHNKGMARDADKKIYKQLLKAVYKNATVILLSWRLYPDIEKIVKKNQVRILPNGIPDVKQYPKRASNPIPQILFLSNLIESKGVLVLLDACRILMEKGKLFHCVFVGGESKEIDKTRFEEEVTKRNLNKSVNYLGKKYGEKKNGLFSQSDLFVFPTFYENECFPLVILEAMQHGLPVVTTSEGAIEDIVIERQTGLISMKNNAEDLASKISFLLENPDVAKEYCNSGRLRFEENFTLTRWEESLISILNSIPS